MADLVAEESRIANELQAISIVLNEQHEDIKAHEADETANARYFVGQQKHGQLTRDLGSVRAERDAYGLREPTAALARKDAPLARWLRKGENGLEAAEHELYLSEISDAGIPGGGGQTFVVRGATSSDDASGQQAVQEEIPPRSSTSWSTMAGSVAWRNNLSPARVANTGSCRRPPPLRKVKFSPSQDTAVTALDLPNIGVQTFGAKTASKPIVADARDAPRCADRHRGLRRTSGAAAHGQNLEQSVSPPRRPEPDCRSGLSTRH